MTPRICLALSLLSFTLISIAPVVGALARYHYM